MFKVVWKLAKIAILFLFILFILYIFVVQPTLLGGTSMEPSFKSGEFFLVDKITYRFSEPKRKDVIIYTKVNQDYGNMDYVGRIVGLPNENILVQKDRIEINGNLLDEPYSNWSGWKNEKPLTIKLGTDEYLVLFDKRILVTEVVKRSQFVGRIFYRYWPSDRAGLITNQ